MIRLLNCEGQFINTRRSDRFGVGASIATRQPVVDIPDYAGAMIRLLNCEGQFINTRRSDRQMTENPSSRGLRRSSHKERASVAKPEVNRLASRKREIGSEPKKKKRIAKEL